MESRSFSRVKLLPGIVLILGSLLASPVFAAEITDRSVSLSSSVPSDSANYTFNFTVPSATPIRSLVVETCEEASGSCDAPAGLDSGSATLLGQPTGFGDGSGWSVDTGDDTLLRMNHTTNAAAPGSSQSVTFGNVTNPSDANASFYLVITTYENDNYTGEIDTGVVAASTAEGMEITGFVPPILTFCVGVTIAGDCTTATGNSLDLGTFSPTVTASGTSQMQAGTNAGDGYVITVGGTTLSSGTNTIPAPGSATASQTGTSQFGLNLRSNTAPSVGSDPSGAGDGDHEAPYDNVDQFLFNAGDIVASAPGPTDTNTYTVSYIANIAPFQAAGNYSTTLTYIATATF